MATRRGPEFDEALFEEDMVHDIDEDPQIDIDEAILIMAETENANEMGEIMDPAENVSCRDQQSQYLVSRSASLNSTGSSVVHPSPSSLPTSEV